MNTIKKTTLGRGLSALLGDSSYESESSISSNHLTQTLSPAQIRPGICQPRQVFNEDSLDQLVSSIRENGIIQPILVRQKVEGSYEIIAGERRWRAAKIVGLEQVPVVIVECDDQHAIELALIENIQRDDLNPLEEAEGYQRLLDEFARTQEDLAKVIGKSRSHIANTLRLNLLSPTIKQFIREKKLSAGHARALINHPDAEILALQAVEKGLSVRQLEKLARKQTASVCGTMPTEDASGTDLQVIAEQLQKVIGLPTRLNIKKHKGEIIINFGSYEELDDLLTKLTQIHA